MIKIRKKYFSITGIDKENRISCIIVNLGVVQQLLNHIQRYNLCKITDKILLTVSGGIDSMVMLHLFRQAGFQVGVAHCNFQLRGTDSQADEIFVKTTCLDQNIPFHVTQFDMAGYMSDNGMSVQMAARELRYRYFHEVAEQFGYAYIATAHHLNDSLETVLLNLTKGTGYEGMGGIPVKNGKIIRPLLFATREMIVEYARAQTIIWREDKSNNSDKYQRNFIRHQIVDRLKEINPSLEQTFRTTQERLQGADSLVKSFIDQFREEAGIRPASDFKINKKVLKNTPSPAVVLWEILKEYGFNFDQCREIITDHQSGKSFLSATHTLIVDREYFFVQRKVDTSSFYFNVDASDSQIVAELGSLHFERASTKTFLLNKKPEQAQLDFEKVKYPLCWRSWKEGDYFVPLGMKHTKKLSDFLIDIKMPLSEKKWVSVIESEGTIIWVVGLRIHDHFKVTEQTNEVLTVDFRKNTG
jgi:tRNA(Ile)-lysidine synthase